MVHVPKVSVLMATYNAGPHLMLAVQSILTQTYTDFEFIVVDDGSTDGSADSLSRLEDQRIRILRVEHCGLVAALNLALEASSGEYVARMDADDIAHVDRLRVEVEFLDSQPDIGIVCSNIRVIDGLGSVVGAQRQEWPSMSVVRDGLLYSRPMKPIIHPTVMMRRELVVRVGGYRDFTSAEDRDLWLRLLPITRFHRIQLDLLDYRMHAEGISRQADSTHDVSSAMAVVVFLVLERTGVDLFDERRELFSSVSMEVRRRLEVEVLPVARVYRLARSDMRAGRWLSAAGKLIVGSLASQRAVSPGTGRKLTKRIVAETALSTSLLVMQE